VTELVEVRTTIRGRICQDRSMPAQSRTNPVPSFHRRKKYETSSERKDRVKTVSAKAAHTITKAASGFTAAFFRIDHASIPSGAPTSDSPEGIKAPIQPWPAPVISTPRNAVSVPRASPPRTAGR
jgi:hypothetical protein